MFTGTLLLAQFATLMLAVGVIPFLPDTGLLPSSGVLAILGLLVGAALLAASAPQLLHRILRSARVPVPSTRPVPRHSRQTDRVVLPTDPGLAGGTQPRAPSALLSVHA